MSASQLLTVDEVLGRLKISRTHLYRLFQTGQLESVHVGRSRRVAESSLERFIAERMDGAGPRGAA